MQHLLMEKLVTSVPPRLKLWFLDFRSERYHYVRTETDMSRLISISTGARQGCVLSVFMFMIDTCDMCLNSPGCKIIKYKDDTAILGFISNNDDSHYNMDTISHVVDWCHA